MPGGHRSGPVYVATSVGAGRLPLADSTRRQPRPKPLPSHTPKRGRMSPSWGATEPMLRPQNSSPHTRPVATADPYKMPASSRFSLQVAVVPEQHRQAHPAPVHSPATAAPKDRGAGEVQLRQDDGGGAVGDKADEPPQPGLEHAAGEQQHLGDALLPPQSGWPRPAPG